MVFRVALQYPNGRTHEAVLDSAKAPEPGTTVFAMYGHTWLVTGATDTRYPGELRRSVDPTLESTRYTCICFD